MTNYKSIGTMINENPNYEKYRSGTEPKTIEEMIEDRIKRHIDDHEDLYTQEDLGKLIPIWREQIRLEVVNVANQVTIK